MNYIKLSKKNTKFLITKIGKTNSRYLFDFFDFGIWYCISAVVAMIFNIVVNSSLTFEEMGKYSYNRNIIELFACVFTLDIYKSYLRFNLNGVSSVVWRIVSKITVLSLVLLSIAILLLTKSLFALPFAFLVIYNERMYMTRSVMDVESVNMIRLFAVLISLILLVSIKYLAFDIKGDYILGILGIGYVYSLFFYKKRYKICDDSDSLKFRQILLFSLPTFAIVIVNWLLSVSGQLFIKDFYGYEDVSKFAMAQRALAVLRLFSGIMLMFYPMVYFREIDSKRFSNIKKIRLILIVILLLLCVIFGFFSHQVYYFLGASKYDNYVGMFNILLIADFIIIVQSFFATYLSYALKTYISLIISIVGASVNLLILYMFLPTYGIEVACYSILISNIIMFIICLSTSYRMEKRYILSLSACENT